MAANHETIVLTGEQALEISVLVDFIQAYNSGLLEEALVMLSEDVVVSDCDYPEVQAVEFLGKVEAEEWLRAAGFTKISRLRPIFPRDIRVLKGIKS